MHPSSISRRSRCAQRDVEYDVGCHPSVSTADVRFVVRWCAFGAEPMALQRCSARWTQSAADARRTPNSCYSPLLVDSLETVAMHASAKLLCCHRKPFFIAVSHTRTLRTLPKCERPLACSGFDPPVILPVGVPKARQNESLTYVAVS